MINLLGLMQNFSMWIIYIYAYVISWAYPEAVRLDHWTSTPLPSSDFSYRHFRLILVFFKVSASWVVPTRVYKHSLVNFQIAGEVVKRPKYKFSPLPSGCGCGWGTASISGGELQSLQAPNKSIVSVGRKEVNRVDYSNVT